MKKLAFGDVPGELVVSAFREVMERRGLSDERPVIRWVQIRGVPCYLRSLTAEWNVALAVYQRENPDDPIGLLARTVAASLCDAEGNPRLTLEQVMQLPLDILDLLEPVIIEVNRLPTGDGATAG